MSKKTWVLVADAAKARLFELPQKDANLIEIACYAHPDSRAPGQHPAHGRLPRAQESNGPARHAIEPRTTLRVKHQEQFAAILSDVMRRGRLERRYDQLVLIAPPRFLGALHKHLDEQTLACVVDEVGNDFLKLSTTDLRARIRQDDATVASIASGVS